MSYQLISILISFVIFTSYITYIAINYGVLPSVSDSYYSLPKNRRWLFTIAFWSFSFPLIIAGESGLMFLAGASICFTGAAPAFKDSKLERSVHVASAVIGIVAAVVAMFVILETYVIGAAAVFIILALKAFNVRNLIWHVEIVAYYSILLALLAYILK